MEFPTNQYEFKEAKQYPCLAFLMQIFLFWL